MALGKMQVTAGGLQIGVAQQELNGVQVGAGFQQMRGERVPQGVLILLMVCTQQGFAIGVIRSMA
jgi:hypothetical protein